jgi:hypothetical protein
MPHFGGQRLSPERSRKEDDIHRLLCEYNPSLQMTGTQIPWRCSRAGAFTGLLERAGSIEVNERNGAVDWPGLSSASKAATRPGWKSFYGLLGGDLREPDRLVGCVTAHIGARGHGREFQLRLDVATRVSVGRPNPEQRHGRP